MADGFAGAARVMAEECLCFRARRVSRAITRMYDEALRPAGIQATQLTVLNAIAMCGRKGAPMSRLADILAMDVTTLSRGVRPLEKDGLVRTDRSREDRRVRVVRLTEGGQRMIEEALPLWNEAHQRVVDLLGPEAAAELRDALDATVAAPGGGRAVPAGSGRELEITER